MHDLRFQASAIEQWPLDRSGTLVGAGDFRAQVQQVFENLQSALEGAGATFADVVKLNF